MYFINPIFLRIFTKFSNPDLFNFSAYYPVFRSMYRNVVAALNEALDITLFLLPLTKLFKVRQVLHYNTIFNVVFLRAWIHQSFPKLCLNSGL